MMKNYNWATLGCGVIANELAQAMAAHGRTLYGVANRTHSKAVDFAKKYGVTKVYDQIEDIFSDPEVDIIYISTPHNTHIKYLRQALAAGKHVLCEKSITLNAAELTEAKQLAEKNNVILAEAMSSPSEPCVHEGGKIVFKSRIRCKDWKNILVRTAQKFYCMGEGAVFSVTVNT